MFYNYYNDFEYDSCSSRGICSIEPRSASLQEVIVMYLKQLSYYLLKLKEMGVTSTYLKQTVINILAGLSSNFNYSNIQFQIILNKLETGLAEAIALYEKLCREKGVQPENLKTNIKPNKIFDITKSLKQGEKEFIRKIKSLNYLERGMFELTFNIIKSICINIITLQTYGKNEDDTYYEILEFLNYLNNKTADIEEIKEFTDSFTEYDYKLTKRINELQTYNYGKQEECEVSFSTRPNKAILVTGENIKELELILNATEGKNIDVYTHGDMILAHTFPKLSKFEHLRGQFGTGQENCLLDYATFPGAIYLAKNSLDRIEYLYRGRLFTGDEIYMKGVIKINENDFSPMIKSTLDAKGFKTGKEKAPLKIGCSDSNLMTVFQPLFENPYKYNKILIMGSGAYSIEQKKYFDELIETIQEDTFLISLTYPVEKENAVYLNTTGDEFFVYKLVNLIREHNPDSEITLFYGKCTKHSLSNMLNLNRNLVDKIYLSKCFPVSVNPRIMTTLTHIYGIKTISNVEMDLRD